MKLHAEQFTTRSPVYVVARVGRRQKYLGRADAPTTMGRLRELAQRFA